MDLQDIVKTSRFPADLPTYPVLAGYRSRVHLGDGCRNPYHKHTQASQAWRHGFELAHDDIRTRLEKRLF